MLEYFLVLLVLFFGAATFYLGYERFTRRKQGRESSNYVQALIDLLDGKQESAFTKLRQVVAGDTTNIDAYLRLGQILRENGQPQLALQVHKDLTLRSGLARSEKITVLQHLASDYLAADDVETAEKALKEIIGLDSHHRWAHSALLKLQERQKNWEEAFHTAGKILRLEGNQSKKPLAKYKFEIGQDLYRHREYHKARIVFKEALGLDPTLVNAYLAVGDSYADEERFEDAVNFWIKLITAVPGHGHLVIDRLKRTLFDLGRFGDIVGICNSILEHDPQNNVARRTLAEFHEKKGDLPTAINLLEQVVDDTPEESGAVRELIRLLLEKNDTRKLSALLRSLERRLDAGSEAQTSPDAGRKKIGA